ncbi:SDR family oxidoreductase [Jannaschia pohangensis]|uniref:NADP-dependent 3-hydroxy acid dehydrogenase YdfG n=1 Tax=Jannaschia pohangensis TaxID=390807 RepID=A0A1I3TKX9_9RHOB|nr:SDR family oxidoreductase [Jannaschia pohangensis]SFJ71280.1 NADP-dependent 3-hydroxy acid dehydrogenase YdfG [Jannaschia pohangensis]
MSNSAFVLGGSAGVGRAVVGALRARGFEVAVIARGAERLAEMEAADGGIQTAQADVGDAAALEAAVSDLLGRVGAPRIWVNCAMATSFSTFDQMEIDEFDKIVRTTFLGQVNGVRLALRHMKKGNIVNIGSGLAYRPVPGQSAYCAAKHAINGFTGAIRSELLRDGRPISLSLVQLPAINTPQFDWARNRLPMKPQPAPPIFAPEVAARAVMQAIDTDAREILVGGSVLELVFGDMVLPNMIDHRLADSGIEMQKSDRPEEGSRADNLFSPVSYPARAEGSFSDRARDRAAIVDGDLMRKAVVFGGLGVAAGLAFLLGRASRL